MKYQKISQEEREIFKKNMSLIVKKQWQDGKHERKFSEEHKSKISLANKGKSKSKEHINNISLSSKKNWKNLEYREKIIGKNHGHWKGDDVGKKGVHSWLRKNKFKLEVCEHCGERKKLDLANIRNHLYTRNPNDYVWLCRSCHSKFDFSDGLIGKNINFLKELNGQKLEILA